MILLLKTAFDGRGFHGFQTQPLHRTVQGTLTKVLSELMGERVDVTGCSRTDAGVHANGFVVSVAPHDGDKDGDWLKIPPEKFHRAANNVLPGDISILGAFPVYDGDFHARYSVVKKEYVYRIDDSVSPSPFLRGRAFHAPHPITDEALSRMAEAASYFAGPHDFTSFMASGSKITDARREVYSASVGRRDGLVEFKVSANGFLYNMVRIMAGTLLDAAEGRILPSDVGDIIAARDRSRAGATLPPDGLYLHDVTYPFPVEWLAE